MSEADKNERTWELEKCERDYDRGVRAIVYLSPEDCVNQFKCSEEDAIVFCTDLRVQRKMTDAMMEVGFWDALRITWDRWREPDPKPNEQGFPRRVEFKTVDGSEIADEQLKAAEELNILPYWDK